jgi:hypothetical protein
MTISIADAVGHILGARMEAPVILVDTCSFVDLFRRDNKRSQPRVMPHEIRAAAELLNRLTNDPNAVHLFVPELIPREYADHADKEEEIFRKWTEFHDENQCWIVEASSCVSLTLPDPQRVQGHDLAAKLRALSDNLLGKANVLERNQSCLERAVNRLINKTRPSHAKEMKDSMNLEQCLELSRSLQQRGFLKSRIWVSSNTNDFAAGPTSSHLHPDLESEFSVAGLKYFTSLQAALNRLRAEGELS